MAKSRSDYTRDLRERRSNSHFINVPSITVMPILSWNNLTLSKFARNSAGGEDLSSQFIAQATSLAF